MIEALLDVCIVGGSVGKVSLLEVLLLEVPPKPLDLCFLHCVPHLVSECGSLVCSPSLVFNFVFRNCFVDFVFYFSSID